ncbi:hypothetical protein D5F01_LYC23767 [Larimichthys crocea]|uniref:Uncharacterized protein n=1 Tax=Larimichthys crocea TaxID=215358 RepID=A0A6G0HFZ7_LARCR|nr:hypothetical protein D5F01_LYC23767 [Larimichthys crocea]
MLDSVSPSTSHSIASSNSSFLSSGADNEGDSDDTITLQPSPTQRNRADVTCLAQNIENILKEKPGGERILTEYARKKSLTDSMRRDMVKILVAHMASEHGTPFSKENQLTTETQCHEAIALMKHTTDEAIIKEKMRQTFTHRQAMVHDPVKSSEIFTTFPRFLDIMGLVEQDFSLMFGDDISPKFLEKWPTHYRQKVLEQSRGLTQTSDLEDLLHNAESTTEELEDGWDSEISSILLLIHLMPPSPHGRNKGKLSARHAIDHLVKFIKTGTSVEGHLDSITDSRQPNLLAVGTKRSAIHKYFIVIDKHAIPCQSPDSLASFDELFKAHFVFATSYNRDLASVYHFLQTAVY